MVLRAFFPLEVALTTKILDTTVNQFLLSPALLYIILELDVLNNYEQLFGFLYFYSTAHALKMQFTIYLKQISYSLVPGILCKLLFVLDQ